MTARTPQTLPIPSARQIPARTPTIGLALGGGGARGLAHIAMLEAFDELGVRPKIIAGTSIGAIYGAAYASGISGRELREHTRYILSQRFGLIRDLFVRTAQPFQRLMSVFGARSAILDPAAVLDLILPKDVVGDFASCRIPLKIVASDFYDQEPKVFTEGSLRTAVAASMALPGSVSTRRRRRPRADRRRLDEPAALRPADERCRRHRRHRRFGSTGARPKARHADGIRSTLRKRILVRAHDRQGKAQGGAARHSDQCRNQPVSGARFPEIRRDPGGRRARQGAVETAARARPVGRNATADRSPRAEAGRHRGAKTQKSAASSPAPARPASTSDLKARAARQRTP